MFTLYNGLAVALAAAVAAVSLGLLLLRGPDPGRLARAVRAAAARLHGPRTERWLTWPWLALVVALGYALVVGFDVATGLYGCAGVGTTSDPVALLHSGQAFWSGGDPFVVRDCGVSTQIPYGLAAVLVNAVGSFGGLAGIGAAWGAFVVAVVPLAWYASPPADRRYVTLFVLFLPIYFPLAAGQIDGASNALVPVAVLLTIVLARRIGAASAVLGGFLATARFPALFPVVASRGPERGGLVGGLAAIGSFAAVTGLAYLRWKSSFYRVVFEGEVNRRSFSLNFYGVLLDHHALPTGTAIVAAQALLIVVVSAAAFFATRSAVRAAALALVGFALLTPFLSFSILIALVPVALVGGRARWWLWAAALVGTMNFDVALTWVAWQGGIYWPSDVLDLALSALLLGLLVELWRGRRDESLTPRGAPRPDGPA